MKGILYLISGLLFGGGLALSGMIDAAKVKNFLLVGVAGWRPALLFVLGSAVLVYSLVRTFLRKRGKTLAGAPFVPAAPSPVDAKLLLGAAIFGIGWGMAGICPGPAAVHLAFLDGKFAVFLLAMVAGIELQRWLAHRL